MNDGTTQSLAQSTAQCTTGMVGCRTRFAGLAAPGMPAERLARLAQALGLAPAAEPAPVTAEPAPAPAAEPAAVPAGDPSAVPSGDPFAGG